MVVGVVRQHELRHLDLHELGRVAALHLERHAERHAHQCRCEVGENAVQAERQIEQPRHEEPPRRVHQVGELLVLDGEGCAAPKRPGLY